MAKLDLSGVCKPLADIFASAQEREEQRRAEIGKHIIEIEIDRIDDFPRHPFKVREDADMLQLAESIRENGVLTPAVVTRKPEGRYEMVSGHRRKFAARLAGLETIPCAVLELSPEEAVLHMVDSNLQRTEILPSERAFAYKMRMEALKRRAGRKSGKNGAPLEPNSGAEKNWDPLGPNSGSQKNSDPVGPNSGNQINWDPVGPNSGSQKNSDPVGPNFGNQINSDPVGPNSGNQINSDPVGPNSGSQKNSDPVGPNSGGYLSSEQLAAETGDTMTQIKRYIRLTELIPALLDMVDERKLAFRPAVSLSYLHKAEQKTLLACIGSAGKVPNMAQAEQIRALSKEKQCTAETILTVLNAGKPKPAGKISLPRSRFARYFPGDATPEQMADIIETALRQYLGRE